MGHAKTMMPLRLQFKRYPSQPHDQALARAFERVHSHTISSASRPGPSRTSQTRTAPLPLRKQSPPHPPLREITGG